MKQKHNVEFITQGCGDTVTSCNYLFTSTGLFPSSLQAVVLIVNVNAFEFYKKLELDALYNSELPMIIKTLLSLLKLTNYYPSW